MKIEEVRVNTINEETRLVLKTIKTSRGTFTNRKLAISNFMYNCEQDRIKFERPVFSAYFQTHHLTWNKFTSSWDYGELVLAKTHADKNNRIFIPIQQRSDEQINDLILQQSEEDFKDILGYSEYVPFQIPLQMGVNEWKKEKIKLLALLGKNQELVPIISSRHNPASFPLIIKEELGKSVLIGINSYELTRAVEITNLSYLTAINIKVKENQKTSLFVNFGYSRILTRLSNVAGCFAFTCFAGDVFSERAYNPNIMPSQVRNHMMDTKPSQYPYYDPKEKKFTKSLPQKEWYGLDITKNSMEQISIAEGLTPYKAIKCLSFFYQQRDLDLINDLIISNKNPFEVMKNYTGWNVFLSRVPIPLQTNQRELSEF